MDERAGFNSEEYAKSIKLIQDLANVIVNADVEVGSANFAVCELTASMLATSNDFEEQKKLFLNHIAVRSQAIRDEGSSIFLREEV